MKKFTKISAIFEGGGGVDINVDINATPGKDDKKSSNVKTPAASSGSQSGGNKSDEDLTTHPGWSDKPQADLIGLKAVGAYINTVEFNSEKWENAVIWELKDKPAFNPSSKQLQDVNRTYYFKSSTTEQDVRVFWKKTVSSGFEPAMLYSGTYTIGGGKVTLTGTTGQIEIIDLATGKVESSNVKVLPVSAQDINLAQSNMARSSMTFNTWYFYMRMFNYKKDDPGFRNAIIAGMEKLGHPSAKWFKEVGADPWQGLSNVDMTINMDYVDKRAAIKNHGYWPVTKKFLSQFAPGQKHIVFGSITDISQPVNVNVSTGKKNFTSGVEYMAYKLEGAARGKTGGGGHSNTADYDGINTVFSDDEARAFWYCLAALSENVIAQINEFASKGGYDYSGGEGGTWKDVILNETSTATEFPGGSYKLIYDTYISSLAKNSGKYFDEARMIELASEKGVNNINNTVDAKFFKSAEDLYRIGGTYLADAMAQMEKYVPPPPPPKVVK